jgi:hypothetical protein
VPALLASVSERQLWDDLDMETAAVALLIGLPLTALVTGRRELLALPLVIWPVWFLGLSQDWWGYGLGDGWPFAALFIIAASIASVAVALAVRSWVIQRGSSSPPIGPL